VGLGGRLDSTNVVQPLVSAVTKIELDHMKYLGDTLEAIAGEKAGIAKPGAPFVIGETRPGIIEVLLARGREFVRSIDPAATLQAHVLPAAELWTGEIGLAGPHQRRNAAIAAAAVRLLPSPWRPDDAAIARGVARAFIPGRLDRRGKWLFDVAHNPDGMRSLVAAMAAAPPPGPVHALVSILGDKDWPEMLVALDRAVSKGVLTLAPTAAGRGWSLEWLERWLRDPARPPARAHWTLVPDFDEAVRQTPEGAGTVLVTGSFHTVGDVMTTLGMEP